MTQIDLNNEQMNMLEDCRGLRKETRKHSQEEKTNDEIAELALAVYREYLRMEKRVQEDDI